MTGLRRYLPSSLAGQFVLLLGVALVAANLVALGLLSFERDRLDRAAREGREIERIVSLLPAIEAADPARRKAIAREASTRFSRVSVESSPIVKDIPSAPRSRGLTQRLSEEFPGRTVRGAIFVRGVTGRPDRHEGGETIAVSVLLAGPETATRAPQWLNVVARGNRRPPPGVREEVFFMVLGLSLVSVLGVGVLFVRRLTRPLGQLAAAAAAAGRGDRSARVPEDGAREMRAAAAAFNDMQTRIGRFDAERMRVLAAVGHDLRTPITSLRIRAELLDAAEAEPIVRTLDEMTVMADGLIAYAKGAGDAEEMQPVDLAALLGPLCEDRGATLRTDAGATVSARPVALKRAIGNLVDNAIRYGGQATVTLGREAGAAVIRIEDSGPGIPPERLKSVFDPFVRGEDSRNPETGGAGLGLSIAQAIVSAHGGQIALTNRDTGGLCAIVTLPVPALTDP
ncbi:ATP-binding protein [Sedimentitalea sp. JM2-8]|uniref:histidine kinase n=1 Tax=Sedimentitalea xiamensis TaxID=3050037 RepID=A0ABT7FHY0_9RHOB|nr:ATP-binding protein [Sedimentitalea xiamensis]MDK3074600.1 ATP-binding protein [Sedimentitalea xiamensis]